jgi:hypothetical protein
MVFNPYSVRPIGSKQFENHLLTLMIKGFETKNAEREAIPEYPVIPRKAQEDDSPAYDPIKEGWKALEYAILCQAIYDYLTEYERRLIYEDRHDFHAIICESRCLQMENEYFRLDPDKSDLLDMVLKYVVHADGRLQYRLHMIRQAKRRIPAIKK